MKTGQYYFDKMSAEEQANFEDAFIHQLGTKNFRKQLNRNAVSNYWFVSGSINWGVTKQGFDYWEIIAFRTHED